ncbi:hypothetical protein B0T16DRAFT_396835 [Cercophora newfieldiana]|uniref:Uncharacterized protein n=1 Tax=Cercophora newfieldiana TaxID=92897 RepID=A0AA39YQD9_9PEZI|nr:hypothetical protein B0T16DRAFT_396835 [Cercophora newfieldiana]
MDDEEFEVVRPHGSLASGSNDHPPSYVNCDRHGRRFSEFTLKGNEITDELVNEVGSGRLAKETLKMLELVLEVKNPNMVNYLSDKKDIVRHWRPFLYPITEKGNGKAVTFNLHPEKKTTTRFEGPAAIAYFLFEKKARTKTDCSTCNADDHRGPMQACIVPANLTLTQGACLNCYYTGKGVKCSHRKEYELRERMEDDENWVPITEEELKYLTTGEIDVYLEVLKRSRDGKMREEEKLLESARKMAVDDEEASSRAGTGTSEASQRSGHRTPRARRLRDDSD